MNYEKILERKPIIMRIAIPFATCLLRFNGPAASWVATGPLATARSFHTATLLPNGEVLVAGGQDDRGNPLSSAELHDPATGMWTTTGALNTPRYVPAATLLSNGRVLVAGGLGAKDAAVAGAEMYDPATATWALTGALNTRRGAHTATLLPNGKVLVAGGTTVPSGGGVSTAELYDPATG